MFHTSKQHITRARLTIILKVLLKFTGFGRWASAQPHPPHYCCVLNYYSSVGPRLSRIRPEGFSCSCILHFILYTLYFSTLYFTNRGLQLLVSMAYAGVVLSAACCDEDEHHRREAVYQVKV